MNKKIKGRIINSLREIHRNYDDNRKNAKKKAKIAPATYECPYCKIWMYEGKSEKNLNKLIKENPKKIIKKGKIQIDHVDPVIKLESWTWNWDDYITRLFCDINNLSATCRSCHAKKTKKENNIRKNCKNT